MKTPRSDYDATQGVLFFPRLLDKLRLKEQGLLPADYNYAGGPVHDCLDGYFCRFFGIDVTQLVARVRAGGSDDEILDWCFLNFGRPDEEKIKFWNHFLVKRGWRDDSTKELEEVKRANGLGDRDDIQTWVDFHDVDEGRRPRTNEQWEMGAGRTKFGDGRWILPGFMVGKVSRSLREPLRSNSSLFLLSCFPDSINSLVRVSGF
jgi:gluconokinase